jgi:hypothetical protein
MNEKILVAITTYAGDFEQRLILRKVVKHLRCKNKLNIFLLIVSDGYILDSTVYELADHVIQRPGPSGLQQGELDSIWQIVSFAKANDFKKIIKSAGDVIFAKSNWASLIINYFNARNIKLLSTHWNYDDSWIIGTKFFVADTSFLEKTLPTKLTSKLLEDTFSHSVSKVSKLKKVVYLINSSTGYRWDAKNELKRWGWEHSHRIHKFKKIDEYEAYLTKKVNKVFLYPVLRIKRELCRHF